MVEEITAGSDYLWVKVQILISLCYFSLAWNQVWWRILTLCHEDTWGGMDSMSLKLLWSSISAAAASITSAFTSAELAFFSCWSMSNLVSKLFHFQLNHFLCIRYFTYCCFGISTCFCCSYASSWCMWWMTWPWWLDRMANNRPIRHTILQLALYCTIHLCTHFGFIFIHDDLWVWLLFDTVSLSWYSSWTKLHSESGM